ncbi:MAG: DNA polymerase Y family protein [Planctomycetota bacterium]|jgi:DNA polymerase-4
MSETRASWVVHVDVDAFFASVEQLLIPSLRDRPVVVGSGCIASCSYEARRLGLRAGMSLADARRQCREAVILAGHYQIYRCFAEHIWDICRQYCLSLETFLDEAYGQLAIPVMEGTGASSDRTDNEQHWKAAAKSDCPLFTHPVEHIGRRLQQQVLDEVHLPVSVGLAANRMMAKLASGDAKPAGVKVIPPGTEAEYLAPLPLRKLLGIGPKLAGTLAEMNITTIGQLAGLSPGMLRDMFGQRGITLYERAHGRDLQTLRPDVAPKSISRETTFHSPTCDRGEISGMLTYLLQRAMRAMREHQLMAGCVEVSIRYDDWKQQVTCRTLGEPVDTDDDVVPVALQLLHKLYRRRVALRHVGVVLSGLIPSSSAGRLFASPPQKRREDLQHAVDAVRNRFGHGSMVTGRAVDLLGKLQQDDYGFVLRTPSLTK